MSELEQLIELRAHGKLWAQLTRDGGGLIFKRNGLLVQFDLAETVRLGRPVLVANLLLNRNISSDRIR